MIITKEFDKLKQNYEKLLAEYKNLKNNNSKTSIDKESTTNITNQIFFADSNGAFTNNKSIVTRTKKENSNNNSINLKLINNEKSEKPRALVSSNLHHHTRSKSKPNVANIMKSSKSNKSSSKSILYHL